MEEEIDQKTQLTWHTVRCLLEAHHMHLQLLFYWCYFRQDAHLLWPSASSPGKWEHLIIWSLWSFSFLKLTSGFAFKRGRPGTSKQFTSIHQIRDIFISLQLWRSSSLDMHTWTEVTGITLARRSSNWCLPTARVCVVDRTSKRIHAVLVSCEDRWQPVLL